MSENEFIFRESADGGLKFVGDFEGYYRSNPDPWQQSGREGEMPRYYRYSRVVLLEAVRRYVGHQMGSGLEIGCGHGHVADMLYRRSGKLLWDGMDVSPTAIKEARRRYPEREFYIEDVTQPLSHPHYYRVVVLGQILWYILHAMPQVLENCHRMLMNDGILVISQAFLRNQRYGRVVADGFPGLIKLFLGKPQSAFRLIEARYDDSTKYVHHDGLLVLRRVD